MKLNISLPKFFFFILSICLTLTIFASSFFGVLYDDNFYSSQFSKNGVYDKTQHPEMKNGEILAYFSNDAELLNQNPMVFSDMVFSDDEVMHLQDVKKLIISGSKLYSISLGISLVLMIGFISTILMKKSSIRVIKNSIFKFFMRLNGLTFITTAALLVISGASIIFFFDAIFIKFHEVLFPQGNWTFSSSSLLITLYSSSFFNSFAMQWLFNILIFLALLGVSFILFYGIYSVNNTNTKPN